MQDGCDSKKDKRIFNVNNVLLNKFNIVVVLLVVIAVCSTTTYNNSYYKQCNLKRYFIE